MFKKLIFTIILSIFIFCCIFFICSNNISAQTSTDAIAIRVIPNSEHLSAKNWYKRQGFTGSPQSVIVDGYNGVRDGRTVYVNVSNVDDSGCIYTNIYLISYNQNAERVTMDIFSQIISHWKFNTNITGLGKCVRKSMSICMLDSDCSRDEYCVSKKAKLIRDTKRLEDFSEIKILLENYKEVHGYYPKLNAGTYLPNNSISVWPSWQERFSQEVGTTIPKDPVNKLGDCGDARFNEITCWDEEAKEFADAIPGDAKLDLPKNSLVYIYRANSIGSTYDCCGVMESGYGLCAGGMCVGSGICLTGSTGMGMSNAILNNPPVFNEYSIPFTTTGQEFNGFVVASDPDGDNITWTFNPDPLPIWAGWSEFLKLQGTPIENQKKLYAGIAGNEGDYSFQIVLNDGRGGITAKSFTIKVGQYCSLPWGGSIPNGDSIIAYQSLIEPCGSSCNSETRTCNNGILSGFFINQNCSVTPCLSCNLPWGGSLNHGASATAYQNLSVPCGSSCNSETRTCNDGVLSGSFINQNCSVFCLPCPLPWGGSINHGASVTTYQNPTEPCGSSCSSETRTCNDGVLSGSLINQSCTAIPCLSCNLPWGGTINHGASATAYQNPTEPCGSSCNSETRTCNNGTLSGSFTNQNCSVAACASCNLPWGGTINHGASATAYQNPTEPCGSSCNSETRTCNNGTLSGSFTNQNCSVLACAASCNLPWGGAIANGSSVTAYQNPTVPCGSSCSFQIRTCNNGTLSGSFTNQNCSVLGTSPDIFCHESTCYWYVYNDRGNPAFLNWVRGVYSYFVPSRFNIVDQGGYDHWLNDYRTYIAFGMGDLAAKAIIKADIESFPKIWNPGTCSGCCGCVMDLTAKSLNFFDCVYHAPPVPGDCSAGGHCCEPTQFWTGSAFCQWESGVQYKYVTCGGNLGVLNSSGTCCINFNVYGNICETGGMNIVFPWPSL